MAINPFGSAPLRHIASYTSSGNFVVPSGINSVFVSIHGASGGGAGGVQNGGNNTSAQNNNINKGASGLISGAFVQVVPDSTYAIAIGAAGTGGNSNAQGGTGGTTSFDTLAFRVLGGAGSTASFSGQNTANVTQASSAGQTTLTTLSPAGAITRTGAITNQNTGVSIGGNAGTNSDFGNRYGAGTGAAGAAGQVYIYA